MHDNRNEIDVTVTIRYHGLKATQYFSKWTDQSMATLRQDLLALKIPHPKTENVFLTSHGCVEFSWHGIAPYQILHKNLISKLRPTDPAHIREFHDLLDQLSIESATFRDTSAGSATPTQHGAKKRAYPYYSTSEYPPHKKFAPPVQPETTAAEKFLSDTFKVLKSEPSDAPMPPAESGPSTRKNSWNTSPDLPPDSAYPSRRTSWQEPSEAWGSHPTAGPTTSAVDSLMKELVDTEKHLHNARGRRDRCMQAIRRLQPTAEIPLEPVERQLEASKFEIDDLKRELEIERRISADLRSSLENLREESKEPFIVPELLDAFLAISNLAARVH